MTRRFFFAYMASTYSVKSAARVQWRDLPELPRPLGGQFVGFSNGYVIVAGGSYFDVPPWDGGKKQFVDTVYALRLGGSAWQMVGRLPQRVASGGAATSSGGVACIGGQTPAGFTAQAYLLRMESGKLRMVALPELRQKAALLSAAGCGDLVYTAGGQPSPTDATAMDSFDVLDVRRGTWERLPSLPASGRILPVLAASEGAVYLASGAALTGDLGPPLGRRFLSDAYCFTPGSTWTRLAPLPHAVQGGAALFWRGRVWLFGGNDGSAADREFALGDRHPGFSRQIYSVDPVTGKFTDVGTMPLSLVTSGAVMAGEEFVIPGGEQRPAHRSARVIAGRLIKG